ncbi:MAG: hypothetical protein K6C98_02125 [Treponema sp.]|nr:hypothetical protein [Treponema sp.]
MKKIKNTKITKTLLLAGGMLFLGAALSAQTAETENIELDDLTTVIKSGNLIAGDDALPNFSDVVEEPKGSGSIVPVLPDVTVQEKTGIADAASAKKEKSVFAEGKVGGGYPALFFGDFSVYRLSGQNPFFIGFNHNSAAGYSGHSLKDGYKDSTTGINITKTVQRSKATINLEGKYQVLVNGLQQQAVDISDVTQNDVNGNVDFRWQFNDVFALGGILNTEFYNRYSAITGKQDYEDFLKNVSVLGLSPSVYGDVNLGAFDLGFSATYWMDSNTNGAIAYDYENPDEEAGRIANRGLFNFEASWQNQIFKAYAHVGALLSDSMNGNYITAPFAIGGSAVFPVHFSNRKASIGLEGGLSAERTRVADLEKKYKFTALNFIPQEVTNWYIQLDTSVPVGNNFTASAKAAYRTTAFGNGVWQPDYKHFIIDDTNISGYYGYTQEDLNIFFSEINLTYYYKILSLSVGLKSNWIDIPVLEYNQLLSFGLGLTSSSGKYSSTLTADFGLDEDSTSIVPIFNLEGYIKLTQAVSIGAEVTDIIKLVSGTTRTYAGEYITRSGTASVIVKFFF